MNIILNNQILDSINLETEFNLKHIDNNIENKTHFLMRSRLEHYRLLSFLSNYFCSIIDIGTHRGMSALCFSKNKENIVNSFDIIKMIEIDFSDIKNLIFNIDNVLECNGKYNELILNSSLIFLDTDPHDGKFETQFYNFLITNNYKGNLLLDDIHLNRNIELFWININNIKFDITKYSHWSGSGIVLFNKDIKLILE
jgi:hypothetical protein